MQDLPSILGEIIPHDDRPWRLDALGAILAIGGRRTPMVEVSLTPYVGPSDELEAIRRETNYIGKRSVRGAVAASDFGFLRMGSWWINGAPVAAFPAYEHRSIDVLTSELSSTIHEAHFHRGNQFVVPPFAYRIPFSSCLLLGFNPQNGGVSVLVPCSEIFRFYYCGLSGKLGAGIIDGTYWSDRWKFVNEAASLAPDSNGTAILRRGDAVTDNDVVELARLQFSPYAKAAASKIHNVMFGHGARARLAARFPFEASTRLGVRGIPFRGLLGPSFLVLLIESCSGPMPFTKLIFERDNEPRPDDTEVSGENGRGQGSLSKPRDEKPTGYTQQTDPASGMRAQLLHGLLDARRYKTKFEVIYRPRKAQTGRSRRLGTGKQIDVANMASGTRTSGEHAQPVIFGPVRGCRDFPLLEYFRQTMKALSEKYKDVSTKWEGIFVFSIVQSEGSQTNRRVWPFLDGKGKRQHRHAAIALVGNADSQHICVEIQRSPRVPNKRPEFFQTVIFSLSADSSVGLSDYHELLSFLVRCRGAVKPAITEISIGKNTMRVSGLRHDDDPKDATARSKSIHEAITRL